MERIKVTNVPKLTHSDLIGNANTLRKVVLAYDHPEILRPGEIPVYPGLLEAEFPYSKEFVDEVFRSVPDSVREDISVLEQALGKKLGLEVTSTGITDKRNERSYDSITLRHGALTGIEIGSADLQVPNPESDVSLFPYEDHPLPLDKAKVYALSDGREIELLGWNNHNITYHGFAFEMFARNFAITFNNLGIERL